jgi:hypothetical protein
VLLEGNGSSGRKNVCVLEELLDEKGPPFVEGPDGVVCWLELGYVSGPSEVGSVPWSKGKC